MSGKDAAKGLLEADDGDDSLSARDVVRMATPRTFDEVREILCNSYGYETAIGWSDTFGAEDCDSGTYPRVCLKQVPIGDGRSCTVSVEPREDGCYACLRDPKGDFFSSARWDFDLKSGNANIIGFLARLEEYMKGVYYYYGANNADKFIKP